MGKAIKIKLEKSWILVPEMVTDDLDSLIGHNAEALLVRENMPNPSLWMSRKENSNVIRVRVPTKREFKFDLSLKTFTPENLRTLEFVVVRVVLKTGGMFFAWEFKGDNKIYL